MTTHEPPTAEDPRPTKTSKPNPEAEEPAKQAPETSSKTLSAYVADGTPSLPLDPSSLPTVAPLPADTLSAFHSAVTERKAVCVLLAAGQGTRFVSEHAKVIHPFAGKPLAQHALDAAAEADIPVVVIVGHEKENVVKALDLSDGKGVYVSQDQQMGTGHAVYMAKCALPEAYDGDIVVSYADNPGVDAELLKTLLDGHRSNAEKHGDKYVAMILTGSRKAAGAGAAAYGRIVRKGKEGGPVVDIVEKKTIAKLAEEGNKMMCGEVEWSAEELDEIDEFNSGIVVAKANDYLTVLGDILPNQTKMDPPEFEYYATDFVKGLVAKGLIAEGHQLPACDIWKLEGANSVEELKELEEKHTKRNAPADENGSAPVEKDGGEEGEAAN